jgi:hypothetical protein
MGEKVMSGKASETIETADRLTFWRNWYTAARQLPDDLRLAWLDAVLDFAFTGKEPKPAAEGASVEDGILTAIGFQAVQMVRATIEISRKRKQSGSKGGAKPKQTRSKAKADRKQVKEQVQVQEQEQEHNANSSTATEKPPTITQFYEAGMLAGVPADFAQKLYKDLTDAGWADKDGRYVGNWRRYMKSAWNAEQKKIRAARVDGIGGFKIAR